MHFVVLVTVLLLSVYTMNGRTLCITPTGNNGECIQLKSCDPLLELLKNPARTPQDLKLVRSSHCGFEGATPLVCCPEPCYTADGQMGNCVSSYDCPQIMNLTSKGASNAEIAYVQYSRCGDADKTIVCCVSRAQPAPSPHDTCTLTAALPDPRGECCGLESDNNRIIGGIETAIDQYPWLALIEYATHKTIQLMCGGSLLSGKYVLTAGHCVLGPRMQPIRPVNVRLGEYDTSHEGQDCAVVEGGGIDCNDGAIVMPIQQTIPHPEYDPNSVLRRNDIALIRLKDLVKYTNFIRPVCLPTTDVFINPPTKFMLYVAGWGVNDVVTNSQSNVKLHVDVPYRTLESCQPIYKVSKNKLPLWHKQICAGGVKNKDSCRGDSGGPLMYQRNLTYEIVGVVSYGLQPCGLENIPGIYTKVLEYVPWIRTQIKP